jgi:hypothetical protein
MRDYKELLSAGTTAQLEKLMQNEHKEGFDNIDIEYAYRRIEEELKELDFELFKDAIEGRFDLTAVRLEAADIANFAHMIILKCDKELSRGF